MNIAHALTIEGWMSKRELEYLAWLANRLGCTGRIAEVGSFRGRSACALAANTAGGVVCVDKWDDRAVFDAFRRNTSDYTNVLPVPLGSIAAARALLELGVRFDVIFIDAAHNYESVSADIRMWSALLRDDRSVLCGHDYSPKHHPGVKRAVDELVLKFKVVESIWTTEK